MILAGTGHRPDKLGGYTPVVFAELEKFAMLQLNKLKPVLVLCGMAQGWDQALAAAAHALKIPFDAYIPFVGQESMWPAGAQARYRELLSFARKEVTCSPGGYSKDKMQLRNIHMVNNAQEILALWDGTKGGTANCLVYARHRKRPIHNCWSEWTQQ